MVSVARSPARLVTCTPSNARLSPAIATGLLKASCRLSPGSGWYSKPSSLALVGTPFASTCHIGAAWMAHTSARSPSAGALSASVVAWSRRLLQLTTPLFALKVMLMRPSFTSTSSPSGCSPGSSGSVTLKPPSCGAMRSTVFSTVQSTPSCRLRVSRTYGGKLCVGGRSLPSPAVRMRCKAMLSPSGRPSSTPASDQPWPLNAMRCGRSTKRRLALSVAPMR